MKFLAILFILHFRGVFCKLQAEQQPAFDRMMVIKNIMTSCLSGKESITVFKAENSRNFEKQQTKMYQLIGSIKPVFVVNNINETSVETFNDMGNELEVPSTTKSYFVMSENVETLTRNLKLFSRVNANGQWIFFTMNTNKAQVEDLLIRAFDSYKMLNLLVFSLDIKSEMHVSTYNPFTEDNRNTRGEMVYFPISQENLPIIVENLKNFFNKKVSNLHGYPLNISYSTDVSVLNSFIDFEIFEVFKRKLNCTFNFFRTRDSMFGSKLPNGTLTG
jgi:hypothetical protein